MEPKPNTQAQPLLSLEGLRFIASVAIVFTHFSPYAMHREIFGGALTIFVDLFFVISGIVMTTAYGSRVSTWPEYGLYMQRRLARLYPLHFATMLFYIAIACAAAMHVFKLPNPARYSWNQLPLYLTMTQAWFGNGRIAWNGVSWSISAELAVYLVFPLIMLLVGTRKFVGLAAVAALLLLSWLAATFAVGQEFTRLASACSWLRVLPSFAGGIWLAQNAGTLRAIPVIVCQAALYGGFAILTVLLIANGPSMGLFACAWIIVGGAYACDLKGVFTLPSASIISRHGNLTYSLYLIHPVVATAWLSFIAPRVPNLVLGSMWIAVAVGFVLTYLLSMLYFHLFEEPARHWFGRSLFRVRDARRGALS